MTSKNKIFILVAVVLIIVAIIVLVKDKLFTQTRIESKSAYITVLSPNGGEVYYPGDKIRISWDPSYYDTAKRVSIYLYNYTSMGRLTEIISSNYPNSGSYNWVIPKNWNKFNTKFEVSIIVHGSGGALFGDDSDNYFTITAR